MNERKLTDDQENSFLTDEEVKQVEEDLRSLGIAPNSSRQAEPVTHLEPFDTQLERIGGLRYRGLKFSISSSSNR